MILTISKTVRIVTALSALVLLCPPAAKAQTVNNGSGGIIPSQAAAIPEYDLSQGEETHPMIHLTPDKPQIVHLDSDARSIIVGNPAHLNAVLDSTRSIVLVPRDPGATHITVIGKDGKVIMQRYVIVAGPAEKYIRVRRNCAPITGGATASGTCAQTTVYFCPDMCHETKIMGSALGQPTTPPAPLSSGSSQASSGEGSGSTESSGSTTGENSGTGAQQPPPTEPVIENSDTSPPEEGR